MANKPLIRASANGPPTNGEWIETFFENVAGIDQFGGGAGEKAGEIKYGTAWGAGPFEGDLNWDIVIDQFEYRAGCKMFRLISPDEDDAIASLRQSFDTGLTQKLRTAINSFTSFDGERPYKPPQAYHHNALGASMPSDPQDEELANKRGPSLYGFVTKNTYRLLLVALVMKYGGKMTDEHREEIWGIVGKEVGPLPGSKEWFDAEEGILLGEKQIIHGLNNYPNNGRPYDFRNLGLVELQLFLRHVGPVAGGPNYFPGGDRRKITKPRLELLAYQLGGPFPVKLGEALPHRLQEYKAYLTSTGSGAVAADKAKAEKAKAENRKSKERAKRARERKGAGEDSGRVMREDKAAAEGSGGKGKEKEKEKEDGFAGLKKGWLL